MLQVQQAPERRVDNLITRTHDNTAMLRMHAVVAEEVRAKYASLRLQAYAACGTLFATGPLAAAVGYYTVLLNLDVAAAGGVGAVGLAVAALAAARANSVLS